MFNLEKIKDSDDCRLQTTKGMTWKKYNLFSIFPDCRTQDYGPMLQKGSLKSPHLTPDNKPILGKRT